jgi:pimeloyl-ACP methyl ester carboxylesterase
LGKEGKVLKVQIYFCFQSFSDDSSFLLQVISSAKDLLSSDDYGFPAASKAPVFVVGFSAGGVMAHRMACQHPDLISAVVSVSGPLAFKGYYSPSTDFWGQHKLTAKHLIGLYIVKLLTWVNFKTLNFSFEGQHKLTANPIAWPLKVNTSERPKA